MEDFLSEYLSLREKRVIDGGVSFLVSFSLGKEGDRWRTISF